MEKSVKQKMKKGKPSSCSQSLLHRAAISKNNEQFHTIIEKHFAEIRNKETIFCTAVLFLACHVREIWLKIVLDKMLKAEIHYMICQIQNILKQ